MFVSQERKRWPVTGDFSDAGRPGASESVLGSSSSCSILVKSAWEGNEDQNERWNGMWIEDVRSEDGEAETGRLEVGGRRRSEAVHVLAEEVM